MRRIPLLLVARGRRLTVISGSALAASRTHGREPAGQQLAAHDRRHCPRGPDADGLERLVDRCDADRVRLPVAALQLLGHAVRLDREGDEPELRRLEGRRRRTIRVEVTATNADGKNQALSAATGAIAELGTAPANTKQPNPSGTATAGQTIKVDDGNWSGSKPITFSYQWQSCNAGSKVCTDIAGVTGSSFVIGTSQIGSMLRATVTATNSSGKNSAFSNLTSPVLAKASAPVNTSLPHDLRVELGRSEAPCFDRRLDGRRGERVQLPVELAVTRTAAAARTSRARPVRATASARSTSAWRSG